MNIRYIAAREDDLLYVRMQAGPIKKVTMLIVIVPLNSKRC